MSIDVSECHGANLRTIAALAVGCWLTMACKHPSILSGKTPAKQDAAFEGLLGPGGSLVLPDAMAALGTDGEPAGIPQIIETLRIEPADGVLLVRRGQSATTNFRALAVMQGAGGVELDLTARTVFYVPDNYLVGAFPADGSATFSVRVPKDASEPAQRGGVVTIQAQAANTGGTITTATTSYTVKLTDVLVADPSTAWGKPAIPDNPAAAFAGSETPDLVPRIVYPNDGVLLPPNLGSFEVHWRTAYSQGTLYEVSFVSKTADLRHYVRCAANIMQFDPAACALELKDAAYEELAQSNRGRGPVVVQVRASDQSGKVGSSTPLQIEFAKDRVDGAVYYWTSSTPPRIMRFDFGSQKGLAPVIQPSDLPDNTGIDPSVNCVGCHALSRDGRHMAVSKGPTSKGWMVYVKDLATPRAASSGWLTVDGRAGPIADANAFTFATFDPTGETLVAVAPTLDITSKLTELIFYDGNTGLRKTGSDSRLDVGFNVTHPDWSPDGSMLAVTRVYGDTSTFQRQNFQEAGISILKRSGNSFALPAIEVVPQSTGKTRYNAAFTPDSSFLLYSESQSSVGSTAADVDGYSDSVAQTWAVAARPGATPILLARSAALGNANYLTFSRGGALTEDLRAGRLMDTFPRPTPFSVTHNGHRLFWFTISSQRPPGLRRFFGNPLPTNLLFITQTLLWMFALDADELAAGRDGSYPGFFLPFQDLASSNHMASWTQKYVSDAPPPSPPPDPLPPTPPAPPPIL